MTKHSREALEAMMAAPLRASSTLIPVSRPRGHPAPPGTGPSGMTCRDCKGYAVIRDKIRKCTFNSENWTHGPATDIRASDPACREFKPERSE